MPKSVIEYFPNILPSYEVLLFHEYICCEHYPFKESRLIGHDFAEVCDMLGVVLPVDCKYARFRRDGYDTTLREQGAYTSILNTKICLPQNVN